MHWYDKLGRRMPVTAEDGSFYELYESKSVFL